MALPGSGVEMTALVVGDSELIAAGGLQAVDGNGEGVIGFI